MKGNVMKNGLIVCLAASAMLISAVPAAAEEKVVLGDKDAWTGIVLVGFNPYGDKKSFYATPLVYKDYGSITVHSRGSDARNGAEEKTELVRFDLSKLSKDAKITGAKLVLPVQINAGKKNAVQVYRVLVPWNEKTDWKTRDGETPWEKEGVHGEEDKVLAAATDVPEDTYSAKEPKEIVIDVTDLVKSWVSGDAANHGLKFEMTGGYVRFAMKGFRLEVTTE
jgi:hypothetical protein